MSADSKVASKWVKSVWVEYNKDYSEEDIYNADKTGLFYNMKNNAMFKFQCKRCCIQEKDLKILKHNLQQLPFIAQAPFKNLKTLCGPQTHA
jgi:hypothetical protein